MASTPHHVAEELALDEVEGLVLSLFQYRLMHRDIAGEPSAKKRARKRHVRDEFRNALSEGMTRLSEDSSADMPDWARDLLTSYVNGDHHGRLHILDDAPPRVARHLTRRSRALLLLIDLYGFEPWGDAGSWHRQTRQEVLDEFASIVPALGPDDLRNVANEYKAVIRALQRKSVKWGRLAIATGGGMALGALTFGLAAPAIGAALGSTVLGLSGAAATSAGLAALGGGSLAAGGLGMAGGTALLIGAGGVAGASALAAGGKWTGWTVGQLVADAIKLEVVTRLVLIDNEGDDEKARKVVEALHQRLTVLAERLHEAASKIQEYREQIEELKKENERKDAEIHDLQDKLRQTQRTRAELELGATALRVAGKRIESAL